MVHYYCFIENGSDLQPDTKVFKVKVGDSRRDQVKRALVDCYAADTDAFFRIWDETTEFHLSVIFSQKTDAGRVTFLGRNVVVTDIKTLYRNILSGTLSSLSNPPHVAKNLFRMASVLSPTFFIRNHASRMAPKVPAVRRKNLSPRDVSDETTGAIGFALILLLYWLGSLVGCWERAVL